MARPSGHGKYRDGTPVKDLFTNHNTNWVRRSLTCKNCRTDIDISVGTGWLQVRWGLARCRLRFGSRIIATNSRSCIRCQRWADTAGPARSASDIGRPSSASTTLPRISNSSSFVGQIPVSSSNASSTKPQNSYRLRCTIKYFTLKYQKNHEILDAF